MMLQGARLIFASTPEVMESPCKDIIAGKYKGRNICWFINYEFTCPECKTIQDALPGLICPHRIHYRPAHQNPEVLYIARAAYGENSSGFKREIMGTQTTTMNAFIHKHLIRKMRDAPFKPLKVKPRYIFVSLDPSGSTKKSESGMCSDYAFVTGTYIDGGFLILGLDAFQFTGHDAGHQLRKAFLALYDHIRADPMLKDSTILYIFENNLGKEHDHMHALIQTTDAINNTFTLYENEKMLGFRTYAHTKVTADNFLSTSISMEGVNFYNKLIVVNPEIPQAREYMREMVTHQIEEMQEYIKYMPNGTFRQVITSIHGQDGKRLAGKKDDVQRSLSMLILVVHLFNAEKLKVPYKTIARLHLKRQDMRQDPGYMLAQFQEEMRIKPAMLREIGELTFAD